MADVNTNTATQTQEQGNGTQMMYYYWKHGRVLPSVFYKLPRGELLVLQAFYEQEIDDNNKELERANKSNSVMYNINLLT